MTSSDSIFLIMVGAALVFTAVALLATGPRLSSQERLLVVIVVCIGISLGCTFGALLS